MDRIQEKNGSGSAELVDVLAEVRRGEREERSYRLDRLIVYLPGELSWEEGWTEKRERRLLPGMKLFCEGELESFEPARNEGEFDYRLYYQSKNICCRMSAERAVAADGEPSPLKAGAYLFKERGRAVLSAFAASVMQGFCLPLCWEIRQAWTRKSLTSIRKTVSPTCLQSADFMFP